MAYNAPNYRRARRGASPKTLSKGLIRTTAIFVLLIHFLAIIPAESHSQEIYYDGKDSSGLQVTPEWVGGYEGVWPYSLFPESSSEKEAIGNRVTIDYDPGTGATMPNSVYGGLSHAGNVTDNTVIVRNGQITGQLRGGFAHEGDVQRNTLIIYDGTFGNVVHGGDSRWGIVTRNTVAIHGGTFTENISSGHNNQNHVIQNTLNLFDGTVYGSVHGAHVAGYGDVVNNTANVSGGVIIKDRDNHGHVYGGYTADGNAIGNSANVTNGQIDGNVIGGYGTKFGNATDNVATISGGKIGGGVYGGYATNGKTNYGSAAGNSVNIISGDIGGDVVGGWTNNAASDSNKVIVSGGKITGKTYGGYSADGDVTINKVYISSGDIKGDVFGGSTEKGVASDNKIFVSGGKIGGDVGGAYSYNGGATGNIVDISGGSVAGHIRGGLTGYGDAYDNTIIIRGGEIAKDAIGGYSYNGGATGNIVDISGGTIGGNVRGGWASAGLATDNLVTVSDGLVNGHVYGELSLLTDATGNTVTISGGKIAGDIYGGHAEKGDAADNTVNIIGAPVLASSYIYGGYGDNGGSGRQGGNTLNFKNSQTIDAKGVGSFEHYNFWLPAGTVDQSKMLVVTEPAEVGGARVEVLLNGESVLHAGDKVALITSGGGVTGKTSNDKSQSMLGTTVLYEFDIYAKDNVLWAALPQSGQAAPESGALTDGHLVSVALLAQAADMAAAPEHMEVSRDKTDSRYVTFAAVNAGSSAYDLGAGSELDIDSFLLIAGVMWDVPVRKNNLLLRAFAEAGWGGYDTNGSYGGSRVRGSGDSNYYGAGLHARYQWTDDNKPGGLYADASLRAGRIEADFNAPDMTNSAGTHASYDTSSAYRSAHVGIGHIWKLGGKTSIDISSKYLWTHLKGDSFTMATGDRVELGSADSRRWRTGFRAVHDKTEDVSFFFGAYYEYEFDGEAAGRAYGIYDIEKASMSGGTGIGELGVIFRPASDDRFSALLGIQGYAGVREGFSGRLKLQYNM